MFTFFKNHKLILFIPVALFLYDLAFQDTAIFWYMYTFSILVLMSIAMLYTKILDEMPTWKSLIYGIVFGGLIYGLIAGGFQLMHGSPLPVEKSVRSFLNTYAPTSIWHYLLLMFLIVPGEEIFWRGFVQQELKKYVSGKWTIFLSSALFALAIGISGFWLGALAGFAAGLVLGGLYEWKRSMPLLIITHLVMIVLLFLIAPLAA